MLLAFLHLVWGQRGGFRRKFPSPSIQCNQTRPTFANHTGTFRGRAQEPRPPDQNRQASHPRAQGLGARLGAGRWQVLQGPSVRRWPRRGWRLCGAWARAPQDPQERMATRRPGQVSRPWRRGPRLPFPGSLSSLNSPAAHQLGTAETPDGRQAAAGPRRAPGPQARLGSPSGVLAFTSPQPSPPLPASAAHQPPLSPREKGRSCHVPKGEPRPVPGPRG